MRCVRISNPVSTLFLLALGACATSGSPADVQGLADVPADSSAVDVPAEDAPAIDVPAGDIPAGDVDAVVADLASEVPLQVGGTLAGTVATDLRLSGAVTLAGAVAVDPGATLTLEAGTTVTAGTGASLAVAGVLVVEGGSGTPVSFAPAAGGSWQGLSVEAGGTLTASNLAISGFTAPFTAKAGAAWTIDGFQAQGTGGLLLDLRSSGHLTHAALHGAGAGQTTDSVAILDASPVLSYVLADGANRGNDFFRVDGDTSAPVFDHVDVSTAHCGFHFNGGTGIRVTSTVAHDLAYGIMVLQAQDLQVSGSDFTMDDVVVGICGGGTVALSDVYADKVLFDASCADQSSTTPAAAPHAGVGVGN